MSVKLYCGDCRVIAPTLTGIDAVITDPPWGGDYNCDYTRFTKGLAQHRNHHLGIVGDDEPFDPAPWLGYKQVILWGYQHFAARLPLGTVLVWLKKRDTQLGLFMSDCELAWQKGGKGVYLFRHIWNGFDRETERGEPVLHPTQKPIALFRWCIERATKLGDTILDPYMGSCPCGLAAMQLGRNFVGIEVVPEYFETAQKRIDAEQRQLRLF